MDGRSRAASDGTAASEKVTTYQYSFAIGYANGDTNCPAPIGPIQSTTVTDPVGGKVVHTFDGSGRETQTQFEDSSGTVLKQITRNYQDAWAGSQLASETTTQGS